MASETLTEVPQATSTSLLDLPVDILFMIFPYLDALSFLRLTATCKDLRNPDLLHEPSYWSTALRTTFRVPNQPVVQHDGERSYKLFKRMFTQSKIYTWGNNEKGCLGHSWVHPATVASVPPAMRRTRGMRSRHVSWPAQMQDTEGLGVVSDLQCGGWSTSMLTAKGAVYTVGVLDALWVNHGGRVTQPQGRIQKTVSAPTLLRYPPGYVQPSERYEPHTAIKQISAGRSHLLGLADSGRLWSWHNIELAALNVKFLHHDITEDRHGGRGTVKKVVAGWNKSAALVEGTGIVLWDPLQRDPRDTETEDAALVLESAVVPKTHFRARPSKPRGGGQRTAEPQDEDSRLAETVGEVQNFVLLEHVILFNTSLGKVFACRVFWGPSQQRITEPVELPLAEPLPTPETPSEQSEKRDGTETASATDVQGSFKRFAVFLRSGEVLTSDQDRVLDLLTFAPPRLPLFNRVPALQHREVISLAFGDYHYHALHSPGYITSYGNEPQACGALGLGGHGDPEGRLRGIRYRNMGGDGHLVPHGYAEGRRVWFDEQKKYWIKFLTSGGKNPGEAQERLRMAIGTPDIRCQGEVSEWIEQEGRDWVDKFGLQEYDDDGLGPYFALSVAAAGWHSGALVLANETLAVKIKEACEVPDPATKEKAKASSSSSQPATNNNNEGQPSSTSLLTTPISTLYDYGRWFLGLLPAETSNNPNYTGDNHAQPGATGGFRRNTLPVNYGASPGEGRKYVWAEDHFPRLRLSDGTEMPGEVGFDEWRYGRPEWDLEAPGIRGALD